MQVLKAIKRKHIQMLSKHTSELAYIAKVVN